jgi:hypothetical protein
MYKGAGLDMDMQMFDPAKMPPGEGASNVYAGADGFMGLGAIPRAIGNMFTPKQAAPVDTAALDLADTQLDRMDQNEYLRSLITDRERRINQLDVAEQRGEPTRIALTPEEIEMTNRDFADIARMQRPLKDRLAEFAGDKYDALKLGASTAYDMASDAVSPFFDRSRDGFNKLQDSLAESEGLAGIFSGPKPEANINQTVDSLDGETGLPVGEGRGNEVATVSEQTLGPLTIDGDSTEILDASKSGIATADPTREASKDKAGGVNTAGDGREVQSDSVFSTDDYRSRLEYLMSLGVDSDKVEIPTLDYSDIRDDLNRRVQSNMLLALGAGIAGGDVSKGIQAASKVSQAGGRDISKIDLAERQGQFEAATAAQKRQDDLLKTQRMLGAELMGLDAKLKVSSDTDRRELIRYYAGIRDGLQDQLVALTEAGYGQALPKASQDLMNRIDKMLQNLAGQYGIILPADAGGGVDRNPAELGGSLDLNLPSRQAAP